MKVSVLAFLKNRSANAATEFAFILPIMLLFIGGIVEFGRVFQAYNGVNRLATRYAAAYADCNDSPSGTCNTELGLYWPPVALKNMAPQLTNTSTLAVRMFQVQTSTSCAPTIVYSYTGSGSATLSTVETQRMTSGICTSGTQRTGVIVTVSYTHQLLFFSTLMSQFIPTSLLSVSYTFAQRKT